MINQMLYVDFMSKTYCKRIALVEKIEIQRENYCHIFVNNFTVKANQNSISSYLSIYRQCVKI